MKNFCILFLVTLGLTACKEKLPEAYGIYAVTTDNFFSLEAQQVMFKGNLISSQCGLKEATGSCFSTINNLIVFEKDIKPKDIMLSKLHFREGASVHGIIGNSYVNVNLWCSEKEIEIGIAPIEDKKDMYMVIPSQPLDSGFYAIHFGSLTNTETLNAFGKVAYDFVIGTSINNYCSMEAMEFSNETAFTQNAEKLLSTVNDYFNKKNYDQIRKIYLKQDGTKFNDSDWKDMVTGFQNWFLQSGKIVSCKITDKQINGNSGVYHLQTIYEKAGVVSEELSVNKNSNSYFISFIGTK